MIEVLLIPVGTNEQLEFISITDAVDYIISQNKNIKKGSAIVTLSKRIKSDSSKPFKGYSIYRL